MAVSATRACLRLPRASSSEVARIKVAATGSRTLAITYAPSSGGDWILTKPRALIAKHTLGESVQSGGARLYFFHMQSLDDIEKRLNAVLEPSPPTSIPEGKQLFTSTGVGIYIERTVFVYLPRYLPAVDHDNLWDGKTFKFLWLCRATLRGYSLSGYDRVVV